MLWVWRAPPLARSGLRVGLRARAGAAAWGWARSAASEANSQQPAAESRQDSQYRDTVLLPHSRFPAQLPGRLQPQTELETQQVAAGAGGARPGKGGGAAGGGLCPGPPVAAGPRV